ncbi:MobP2 family relaxase [Clostridium perfringens]|nr:MobP2 family relaxase [Clostridium perfringens]MCX0386807.1 relaxase MobL [Clostridium perfringens]MCX0407607.1 relaxase MobL [Clostridium perfringens]WEV08596.1 relaxase MobL [Clostridium perfringens B]
MSKEVNKITPAIVHKVRWVSCGNKKFKSYIDYIDRDEATRNYKFDSFSLYNDYMGNPEKSGSIFTEKNDYMTQKEIKELKKNFELAQENKSMMWQDVFSFNNDWLIENGYLNPNTKVLDEAKIRNAIRKSMAELTKDGNENELIWSASIHYNTRHIHVHVASVELKPNKENLKKDFRERGKRKMKVIKTMKSKFINDLRNRDEFYQELDVLVRDNMVGSKKEYSFMKDRILREKMLDMLRHLPKDKREWNYERIKEAKPYVDSLSKYYVENFCRDDFQRFKKMVIEDRKEQLKIYGTPKDLSKLSEPHYKEADLYRRMGNTIIKELKDFVKEEEYKNKRLQYLKEKKKYKKKSYRSKKENEKKNKINLADNKKNYDIKIDQEINKPFEEKEANNNEVKKEDNNLKNEKREENKNDILDDKKINNNKLSSLNRNSEIKYKNENKSMRFNLAIAMNNVKRAIRNDLEHYINMLEFEKMERQKEYESGLEI